MLPVAVAESPARKIDLLLGLATEAVAARNFNRARWGAFPWACDPHF